MAFSAPRSSTFATIFSNISKHSSSIPTPIINFPQSSKRNTGLDCRCISLCYAAAKQQKSSSAPKKKKKPSTKKKSDTLIGDGFEIERHVGVDVLESASQSDSPPRSSKWASKSAKWASESDESPYSELPLPKPPAGFVLDEQGNVLLVSKKRLATIVDPVNNAPLECVIRRVFKNSQGDECMILCPADMAIQILKSVNVEGWIGVSDEEVAALLPAAEYALAKVHIHLVHSGFCYTARGGFCFTEGDIFEIYSDNGEDGLPTEGVEIVTFNVDGSHYMIFTPSDPLFFVAVKDKDGTLQIANDDIMEDPAVVSAIDEETEFNALVEEEEALFNSAIGKGEYD